MGNEMTIFGNMTLLIYLRSLITFFDVSMLKFVYLISYRPFFKMTAVVAYTRL